MLSVSFIFYLITKVSHGSTLPRLSSMNKRVMNCSPPPPPFPTVAIYKRLPYMSELRSITTFCSYVSICYHLIYMSTATFHLSLENLLLLPALVCCLFSEHNLESKGDPSGVLYPVEYMVHFPAKVVSKPLPSLCNDSWYAPSNPTLII